LTLNDYIYICIIDQAEVNINRCNGASRMGAKKSNNNKVVHFIATHRLQLLELSSLQPLHETHFHLCVYFYICMGKELGESLRSDSK